MVKKYYQTSKKFKEWWDTVPLYHNRGSSLWAYRTWKALDLNAEDSAKIENIIAFSKDYYEKVKSNKFIVSPGKVLELGFEYDFEHETEEQKFRRLYTRGVR